MAIDFKGSHLERDIILWGVRWYLAYPISYRQLEEMMSDRGYNAEHDAEIVTRQIKYLNNIVEQDHRAIKRLTRPMLGFKSFWSAAVTIAGIEMMHMIRKGQLRPTEKLRPAQQLYSLAG
jgi:transposase-like protein|nr:DDE-type integrase/transposase/recombinase [Acidisoma sp. PAMC 29798]